AAHRVAHQHYLLEAKLVHDRGHISPEGRDRVVGPVQPGIAVAGEIDRDHAVALSQGQLVFPVTAVAGPTVDEYQRGRGVAPDLISDRGAVCRSSRAQHDTIVA